MSSQKCVHKGCGKVFTDPDEPCIYHPGPPEFHEGQKGWKCCKPRVLTFDEFLEIPPCTTGKHSTVDENAVVQAKEEAAKKAAAEQNAPKRVPISRPQAQPQSQSTSTGVQTPASTNNGTQLSAAAVMPPSKPASPAPELEEDSDDPATPIPDNASCKRRACGRSKKDIKGDPLKEDCIFHPGIPIFHEGSKGWTCCKRRVLEFDEFLKIEGCKTRQGHCFIGKRTATNDTKTRNTEDKVDINTIKSDFYQGANTINASIYLKKIDKARVKITFRDDGSGIDLDLPTADGKRAEGSLATWAAIKPAESSAKVMGTKLELVLAKAEPGVGWPVLKKGDRDTGERIQIGRAGRA